MAKELEQKTFKLHDSFDPQATRFVPGPADMAKEEVHSMPSNIIHMDIHCCFPAIASFVFFPLYDV